MLAKSKHLCLVFAFALAAFLALGCGSGDASGESSLPANEVVNDTVVAGQNIAASSPEPDGGELDWCAPHAVPESECTACNPSLIQSFKDKNDWCAPHDLPESHCRLCNPGISFPQEDILRTRSAELAETGIEISLNFRPNAEVCATDGALIQFATASTADRAGIGVQHARASTMESVVQAPAEVVFDEAHATVVTSTVPALVSRWLASPGDVVAEGNVLAILQSPEIAELKSTLVSAQAAHNVQEKELERHRKLKERGLISEADFDRQAALAEQARAELVSARGLLLSAGLDQTDIQEILEYGSLSNTYALRASASGMIVERIAKLGELLEAGRAFAMLADPSSMWIEARLTERQIRQVELGQQVTFTSDGSSLHRVGAEVIWVSRVLDPHTRTGVVRARVVDPEHRLQAGEFGRVRIVDHDNERVILVPKDAVQWEGCCNVVFVKETATRYRPRKVDLRDGEGGFYQVASGLEPGENVVVDGAFLLKTELKKSSIGAGCCGLDPVG